MRRRPASSRPAFTLLELGAVVVIAGVIAVSVIPAVGRIAEARAAAAAFEIARSLDLARANALAAGLPCGIRFDVGSDLLEPLTVSPAGIAPTPGPLGEGEAPVDLRAEYGADISRASFPPGPLASASLDTATLWFDHDGAPHLRDHAGSLAGPLAAEGLVGLQTGQTVRIATISGLVEVRP